TNDELRKVDCYDPKIALIFVGYTLFCFGIATLFLVSISTHIFVLLRDVAKISMSEKTRNYHHIMTRALGTLIKN
ncbi:hypothetical protein PMAYCL1PPCAC_32849, partial [Pristionchus mayeri]